MLHCEPRHVSLLKSTGEGLGLLAQGLDWRDGDEVVVYEHEFSGCLAPFLHLHDRGVRVREPFPTGDANRFASTTSRGWSRLGRGPSASAS